MKFHISAFVLSLGGGGINSVTGRGVFFDTGVRKFRLKFQSGNHNHTVDRIFPTYEEEETNVI